MSGKYEEMSMQQIAESYQQVHADMIRLTSELQAKEKEWADLREKHIPRKMKILGIEQYRFLDTHAISLRVDARCIFPQDKVLELSNWLNREKRSDLILKRIDTKKFKQFIQERIIIHKEIPPEDMLIYTPFEYAKIIKSK